MDALHHEVHLSLLPLAPPPHSHSTPTFAHLFYVFFWVRFFSLLPSFPVRRVSLAYVSRASLLWRSPPPSVSVCTTPVPHFPRREREREHSKHVQAGGSHMKANGKRKTEREATGAHTQRTNKALWSAMQAHLNRQKTFVAAADGQSAMDPLAPSQDGAPLLIVADAYCGTQQCPIRSTFPFPCVTSLR